MNRSIANILFCLLAGLAPAAEPSRFDRANREFADGNFAKAADIYQGILETEGPPAAVLFNLGNAEQKLGNHGRAILAYERARLIAPRDPDLRANLALSRKAAAVFEEPRRFPRLAAFFDYLSLNEWSWLFVGSTLFVGVLAIVRGTVRLPRRWMRNTFRGTAGLAVVAMIVGATALYQRQGERDRGVVLTEDAPIRLSPFEKAGTIGAAGAGRIVRLLETKDGFHYVEVPGTELRGWIADRDVAAIQSGGFGP
jgi:tetratricopeptide (TPR) repeat protein